ncbi:purple acid phosphatase family protein [Streptomyces montanisoli]|uniref:Metallophosphoesterase family protein n=1 Tax=Streptomyces montanisoli TaxID=2798581 RepID=A0A940MBI1_9ACTN|nr:metallophosphoesterase family protein [Streptomyces montanisoli]MBP0457406.1 metallophosphoesterase family protein [Streptomyces montanisoli]
MRCCPSARHELLHRAAIWAAALAPPLRATPRARGGAVAPVGLELVTLTEDRAIFTWYTGVPGTDNGCGGMLPAVTDGEIAFGAHPGRLDRHVAEGRNTAYHQVEVTGLEPGRTYYYQARSHGRAALPTPLCLVAGNAAGTSPYGLGTAGGPYAFTTPQPPPGRYLFAVALCNDLHLGETTAGRISGLPSVPGLPQLRGIAQPEGLPPYPELMGRALVEEALRRGADYLLAAGDISAEAGPADLRRAKEILDGFGPHDERYFTVRGNHDRPRERDGFRDTFPSGGDPAYFARDLGGLRVVGLDTYDKPGNGGDGGGLSPEQMSWFLRGLRDHKDQPTVVFGHHPLSVPHSPFPATHGQRLGRRQARAILAAYGAAPGVFLHHAGHTHRNKRSIPPHAPRVTLQEVSAVKEYPGGFCLLRVHSGGFALNYYKAGGAAAREWSERSRSQAAGLWPQFSLGRTVADRNSMTARDLSGVRAPHRPPVPPVPPVRPVQRAEGGTPWE